MAWKDCEDAIRAAAGGVELSDSQWKRSCGGGAARAREPGRSPCIRDRCLTNAAAELGREQQVAAMMRSAAA